MEAVLAAHRSGMSSCDVRRRPCRAAAGRSIAKPACSVRRSAGARTASLLGQCLPPKSKTTPQCAKPLKHVVATCLQQLHRTLEQMPPEKRRAALQAMGEELRMKLLVFMRSQQRQASRAQAPAVNAVEPAGPPVCVPEPAPRTPPEKAAQPRRLRKNAGISRLVGTTLRALRGLQKEKVALAQRGTKRRCNVDRTRPRRAKAPRNLP